MTTEAETLTGRQLDIELARALGYHTNSRNDYWWLCPPDDSRPVWFPSRGSAEEAWNEVPAFSTSPDAAINLVVAAMRRRDFGFALYHPLPQSGSPWSADFVQNAQAEGMGFGDSAPEAICKAALAALRTLAAEQEAGQ